MRITQPSIAEVSERTDMVALVNEYTRLEKRGGSWWGACPFHNEKTPSFKIDPAQKVYYCFGCHAGGSVINFYQEIEKVSFVEAVQALAKRAGVQLEYDGAPPAEAELARAKNDEALGLYGRVAGTFHFLLTSNPRGAAALSYIRSRGISDEVISRFMLGYAPKERFWLKKFLTEKHYSAEFLRESGLFTKANPDAAFFYDRLIFPIHDKNGAVVAFGGRILSSDGPKYLNSPDMPFYHKGETLYAFHIAKSEIRAKKAVILCEGYMDVIAYHQCGIKYAVAPLGTALTQGQVRLVKHFVDTVYLSFDSDGAGKSATQKAIILCRQEGLETRVIRLGGAKDPAEIMQNFGTEYLTKCVENSIIDREYVLSVVSSDYPLDTPEGKTKAALAFFPYVDSLSTDMQKQSCLDILCQTLNLSQEAVRHDYLNRDAASLRGAYRKSAEDGQSAAQQSRTGKIKLNAELRTVLSVIANFEFFPELRAALVADDFEDSLARGMFISMEECYRQEAVSVSAVMSRFEDSSVKQLISDAITTGEYSSFTLDAVKDSIRRIKRNSLERQRLAVQNQIRQITVVTLKDQKRLDGLLSQKMYIDSELKK
ncbi:MAG: DNA primase [Treponemataceae bacterium]|nr:MAG: DNA primase [Treponemataceae bacterium]